MNERHRYKYAAALVVFIALAGWSAAAGPSPQSPPDQIGFHTNPHGVVGTVVTVYLQADVDSVYRALSDPGAPPKLFSNVRAIVADPDAPSCWTFHVSSPLGSKAIRCEVQISSHQRSIHWKRIDGDLVEFEGHWKIWQSRRFPDYTVVRYVNYINPGGLANLFFTNNKRRRMAESMIPKLRRLVDAPSGISAEL